MLFFTTIWAIAIISCFSMRRIRNELHYVNNILANKKFMTIYTCVFVIIAVEKLLECPMGIVTHLHSQHDDPYYKF